MDDAKIGGGNGGLTQRSMLTASGAIASFETPLHHDICQMNKLLLNNVPINVKLHQSADSFRLMTESTTEAYSVEIKEIKLKVCHVVVSDLITVAHSEALSIAPSIYSYWRSALRTYDIASGSSSFSADDLLSGIIPSKCVVAFVSSSAYAGSYQKNPFNYQNFKLSFLEITLNGNSVPGPSFQPNYQTNDYIECYSSLFFNKYPSKTGNWITRTEYPAGYCLYVFNIAGHTGDDIMSEKVHGHTRLHVKFAEALKESVKVIVYCQYPDQFYVNKSRDVLFEL